MTVRNVITTSILTGALAASLVGSSASAATITFDDLPGSNRSLFTTSYSEAGFTLSYVSGSIYTAKNFGNPTFDLYFSNSAAFDITGGVFTLGSFDGAVASGFGDVSYAITGFLNGRHHEGQLHHAVAGCGQSELRSRALLDEHHQQLREHR